MRQQTVYVPVSVEDELPSVDGYYNTICGSKTEKGLIHYNKDTGWQNGFYNDDVTHWLKEVQNVNILTDAELLELKKKWMEQAFDSGSLWQYAELERHIRGRKNEFPDKQSFLNSIKLY